MQKFVSQCMKSIRVNKNEYLLAPFWRRFLAGIIDLIVLFSLLFVPVVNFVLIIWYAVGKDAFPFLPGGSIGKFICGLKIISRAHGSDLKNDYLSSIGRNLFHLLLIDIFIALLKKNKRRIGDEWVNCDVVLTFKTDLTFENKDRFVDLVNRYEPIYLEREEG